MKKMTLLLTLSAGLLLGGCSEVNETISTAKYVGEVVEYTGEATTFINTFPLKLTQATLSEEKTRELNTALLEMESDIEEFNTLVAPESFVDKHEKILVVNENLLKAITFTTPHTQKGVLSKEVAGKVKNSFTNNQHVKELSVLIEDIKKLGN